MQIIKYYFLGLVAFISCLSSFSLFYGCATPTPVSSLSLEEIVRRQEAFGSELAEHFEEQLTFRKDVEVSLFLKKITQSLVDSTPQLRGGSVGVWVFRNDGNKWPSYSLPGNRIYLSLKMLQSLEFENEVASVIAIQLGHLMRRDLLEQLKKRTESEEKPFIDKFGLPQGSLGLRKIEYFGTSSIFSFPEDAFVGAVKTAVGILYRSGYDARGLISFCTRFQEDSMHSPYEKTTLLKMIDQARREISMNTPIRNPIVSSHGFLMIQRRVQSL